MFKKMIRAARGFISGLQGKRGYVAGESGRLHKWRASRGSADSEIRSALDSIRMRSRDLSKNNPYIRKWLQMVQNNVVGPNGFKLQVRADEGDGKDKAANDAIESAFAKWASGDCDFRGKSSLLQLDRLIIKQVARDGEAIVRKIRGANNEFGFALQLLDIARLPVNYSQQLSNAAIRMGVEFDNTGRAVALHLLTRNPNDSLPVVINGKQQYVERIPISDIYHIYLEEEAEQSRGVPWAHASMHLTNMLDGYNEAALVAARAGAAKMGFFTSPTGEIDPLADVEDDEGEFLTSAEAGTFQVLPKGYEFHGWDPRFPHQNHSDFVKSILRELSTGLGICYHSLANDLTEVNFSSMRGGVQEERLHWLSLQNWYIDTFKRAVYRDWLECALLKGAIKLPNGSALPAAKLSKFLAHKWYGLRWPYVDPSKDIAAAKDAIAGGLKSRTSIIAETGADIEDVFAELRAEQELARKWGIEISCEKFAKSQAAAEESADISQ